MADPAASPPLGVVHSPMRAADIPIALSGRSLTALRQCLLANGLQSGGDPQLVTFRMRRLLSLGRDVCMNIAAQHNAVKTVGDLAATLSSKKQKQALKFVLDHVSDPVTPRLDSAFLDELGLSASASGVGSSGGVAAIMRIMQALKKSSLPGMGATHTHDDDGPEGGQEEEEEDGQQQAGSLLSVLRYEAPQQKKPFYYFVQVVLQLCGALVTQAIPAQTAAAQASPDAAAGLATPPRKAPSVAPRPLGPTPAKLSKHRQDQQNSEWLNNFVAKKARELGLESAQLSLIFASEQLFHSVAIEQWNTWHALPAILPAAMQKELAALKIRVPKQPGEMIPPRSLPRFQHYFYLQGRRLLLLSQHASQLCAANASQRSPLQVAVELKLRQGEGVCFLRHLSVDDTPQPVLMRLVSEVKHVVEVRETGVRTDARFRWSAQTLFDMLKEALVARDDEALERLLPAMLVPLHAYELVAKLAHQLEAKEESTMRPLAAQILVDTLKHTNMAANGLMYLLDIDECLVVKLSDCSTSGHSLDGSYVRCTQVDLVSTAPEQGIPFTRYSLLVRNLQPTHDALSACMEQLTGADAPVLLERGTVLTAALEFQYETADCDDEDEQIAAEEQGDEFDLPPLLTYLTSSFLSHSCCPNIARRARLVWRRKLDLSNAGGSQRGFQVRKLLYSLLTGGVADPVVALVSVEEMALLVVQLQQTKHEMVVESVESSNLQSFLRQLERMARNGALVFMQLQLSQRMSSTECSALFNRIRGSCVRVLLIDSTSTQTIVNRLESGLVVPRGVASSVRVKSALYSPSSAIGHTTAVMSAAVLEVPPTGHNAHIGGDTAQRRDLICAAVAEALPQLYSHTREELDWAEVVRAWVEKHYLTSELADGAVGTPQRAAMYLLTSDTALITSVLAAGFQSAAAARASECKEEQEGRTQDASAPVFASSASIGWVFVQGSNIDAPALLLRQYESRVSDRTGSPNRTMLCSVVLGADQLSHMQHCAIVSSVPLPTLFVMPSLGDFNALRLQVQDSSSQLGFRTLSAQVLRPRFRVPQKLDLEGESLRVFRTFRLLFGGQQCGQQAWRSLQGQRTAAVSLTELFSSKWVASLRPSELACATAIVQSVQTGAEGGDILSLVASFVEQYGEEQDVSFDDFVNSGHVPSCVWLSAAARLTLWLEVCMRVPRKQLPALAQLDLVVEQNSSLLQMLAAQSSPIPASARRSGIAYTFTPLLSSSLTSQEMLVQQACGQEELDWQFLTGSDASRLLQLNTQLLSNLVTCYPHSLKLLCALNVQNVFTLLDHSSGSSSESGEGDAVFQRLATFVGGKQCDALLLGTSGVEHKSVGVAHLLSTIKWLLIRHSQRWQSPLPASPPSSYLSIDRSDLQRLLDLRMYISADDNADLWRILEHLVFGLDGPSNVLVNQVKFKSHVLAMQADRWAELESDAAPLGVAFFDFVCNSAVQQLAAGKDPPAILMLPFVRAVIAWQHSNLPTLEQLWPSLETQCHRLKPSVLSFLLSRAMSAVQVQRVHQLIQCWLQHRQYDKQQRAALLVRLTVDSQDTSATAASRVTRFLQLERNIPGTINPLLHIDSMGSSSQQLAAIRPLAALIWGADVPVGDIPMPFLPLHCSPALCDGFVAQYADVSVMDHGRPHPERVSALARLIEKRLDVDAIGHLFERLNQPNNKEHRMQLWMLWCKRPQLQLRCLPEDRNATDWIMMRVRACNDTAALILRTLCGC